MQADAEYLPAQLGLAATQGRRFEGRVRQALVDILATHPDNLRAHVLLARIELEMQRVGAARALLYQAEQLAAAQQLSPLDIFALQASADLLERQYQSEWTNRALTLNPRFGNVYAVPAHFYIITYRYREAVDLYRKAVSTEPDLADAQSKLGINLLRINDIHGARHHLGKAFELDPFNPETVNTLRLLDDLDGMRVSWHDIPDPDAPEYTIGRMMLRLDHDAVDALEPYVVELTARAVQLFTRRYDFQLRKPVVVELYHDHDDFGVRTVSTPGIGLLGVTFGYLLAMDSPKARSSDNFHWGSTLWHELAHVFTLEAANHLLPRWFSEGISVYEEWNTGPSRNRELPLQVLQMLQAGEFLPIVELDNGFVRPRYEGQVNVSYMQAGLICDYIAATWGHNALVKMLKQFSVGRDTGSALETAIGISADAFDRQFFAHLLERYQPMLADLQNWSDGARRISFAIASNDWERVLEFADERIELFPEHVGSDNAYMVKAQAHEALGDPDAALQARWQWFDRGGYKPDQLQSLARDLRVAGRDSDAFKVMEALNWVMPYVTDEHRQLANYYLENGEWAKALREFDALLGVRPEDTSIAYLGKARVHRELEQPQLTRRNLLYALETAPFYREAQQLLLEITPGEQP